LPVEARLHPYRAALPQDNLHAAVRLSRAEAPAYRSISTAVVALAAYRYARADASALALSTTQYHETVSSVRGAMGCYQDSVWSAIDV
jgi:hypothetical protein